MKRIICIILILCIVFTCFAITTYATGKITDTLQEQIDQIDEDDTVKVQMWVHQPSITEDELKFLAYKDAGLSFDDPVNKDMDMMNRYIIARRHILFNLQKEECKKVVEQIEIANERIIEISGLVVVAEMNKSEIITAAQLREVETILFDEYDEESIEDCSEYSEPNEGIYKQQFDEYCCSLPLSDGSAFYEELFYHYNDSYEIDWILVHGSSDLQYDLYYYNILGNRLFMRDHYGAPFILDYGIYDVNKGTFIDPTTIPINILNDTYKGFVRIFDKYGGGRLLGDLDGDNELTIIDCTLIQRCDIHISDWPKNDLIDLDGEFTEYTPLTYYSDFDRNGERDIVDATKLQRYVTGIG